MTSCHKDVIIAINIVGETLMDEFKQRINNIRARIAALRFRLEHRLDNESILDNSPREQTPIIETTDYDQSAIDERKAKSADLDALRAKLRGK